MSERNDPMYYEFDVCELKTNETHRARMFCWWSDDASIRGLREMCDCQLGAFFLAAKGDRFPSWETFRHNTRGGNANNAFVGAQFEWLKQNKCDHSGPSRRYAVLRAVTPAGDVIELGGERRAA